MVKICLAGIEPFIDILKEAGVKYVLMSYYYADKVDPKELEDFKFVILDSGAFTYYNKASNASLEERWDYVKRYVEWVNKYIEYFDVVIEFDFGSKEEVAQFREYMKENVTEPEKIMPVVQKHFGGVEYFEQLANEGWEYIAIPSDVKEGKASKKEFSRKKTEGVMEFIYPFIKEARKYGIKLHGLALTKWEILDRFKKDLFSVDSSSWIGGKFGTVYYLSGKKLEKGHWKSVGAAILKKLADEYSLSYEKLKSGDSIELNRLGAHVWAKLQDIYDVGGEGSEVKASGFCCKVCPVADKCSSYDENAEYCVIVQREMKQILSTEDVLEETIKYVLEQRIQRYVRARVIEDLEGGLLDKHVTALEDGIAKLIETYLRLKYPERYGKGVVVAESLGDYEAILKRLEEYDRGQE